MKKQNVQNITNKQTNTHTCVLMCMQPWQKPRSGSTNSTNGSNGQEFYVNTNKIPWMIAKFWEEPQILCFLQVFRFVWFGYNSYNF